MQLSTDHDLARCEADVVAAMALAWQLLGAAEALAAPLSELGNIQLPPVTASASDQANLRAAAPLYVAAELEHTHLLDVVEVLSRLYVTGAVRIDLGSASERLVSFWRQRHERFSPEERQAMFSRLFGGYGPAMAVTGGSNRAFEAIFIELTGALHRLRELDGTGIMSQVSHTARVRTSAQRLVANLAPRSGGLAAFAARELLDGLQQALDILRMRSVQAAVQASGVWSAVSGLARRYLQVDAQIAPRITRARTGQRVIAWVADFVPALGNVSTRFIRPRHPVLPAATEWLQATAELEDQ